MVSMSGVQQSASTPRTRIAKAEVAELAERQWGLVTRAQLEAVGLTAAGISRWQDERRLHRIYPRVFAVGHGGLALEGKLAAALLYAGPGAALWGVTAGYWLGLLKTTPSRIHVCTPRRRRSLRDVRIHGQRECERVWHQDLPVTPPARTLLDIATQLRLQPLRSALAEAEYLKLVTIDDVRAVLGPGRPGSAALRVAVECHNPRLAKTKSKLEEKFLRLCELHLLPLPDVNAPLEGYLVDAAWFDRKLVVELDGRTTHSASRVIERDHQRDLDLRAAGYTVLRYTWQQVTQQPERVVADLKLRL
jgi:very-short-patch-repair endonuclease